MDQDLIDRYIAKLIQGANHFAPRIIAWPAGDLTMTAHQGNRQHAYYDGGLVYREMVRRFADRVSPDMAAMWAQASDRCVLDYVTARRPLGWGRGYNSFPRGIVARILARGETPECNINDIHLLARGGGSFVWPGGFGGDWPLTGTNTHRELAYAIVAETAAERMGLPRDEAEVRDLIEAAESQMWQMHSGQYIDHGRENETEYHFFQPFMRGLMWDAFIDRYEFEAEQGRDFADLWPDDHWPDWMTSLEEQIEQMRGRNIVRGDVASPQEGQPLWNEVLQRWAYIDRGISGEVGGSGFINYEADLNMLVAVGPAWLAKNHPDPGTRARMAEFFDDHVQGSLGWYLGDNGKQFNQQAYLGLKALDWRLDQTQPPVDLTPVITGVRGKVDGAMFVSGRNLEGGRFRVTAKIDAQAQSGPSGAWVMAKGSATSGVLEVITDAGSDSFDLEGVEPW